MRFVDGGCGWPASFENETFVLAGSAPKTLVQVMGWWCQVNAQRWLVIRKAIVLGQCYFSSTQT